MDFNVSVTATKTGDVIDESWPGYPQNQFGNWTPDQVGRSQMLVKCAVNKSSTIYWMDVHDSDGRFGIPDIGGKGDTSRVTTESQNEFWDILQEQVSYNMSCV